MNIPQGRSNWCASFQFRRSKVKWMLALGWHGGIFPVICYFVVIGSADADHEMYRPMLRYVTHCNV